MNNLKMLKIAKEKIKKRQDIWFYKAFSIDKYRKRKPIYIYDEEVEEFYILNSLLKVAEKKVSNKKKRDYIKNLEGLKITLKFLRLSNSDKRILLDIANKNKFKT